MVSNTEKRTGPHVPPLDTAGLVDDAVSSVTGRSLSLTGTSGVKSSDTGSSGIDHQEVVKSSSATSMEKILVPKAVQNEEHYKQLLEQGKLRHGSIIKKKNRPSTSGSQIVFHDMDGHAHRMPKAASQSSLMQSESSIDVSHDCGAPSPHSDAGSTAVDSKPSTGVDSYSKPTRGYTIRERDAVNELWIFIVNGLKRKVWEKKCGRLLNQLSLVKWKVYVTRYPGHARKLAYRAQNKGADMIIAVGGDGTLQEIVDGMMRSHCKDDMGLPKAVLTVLPAGSSNDFHRSMGWDLDFEDGMWRIGHRGETALVDVGKVTCVGPSGGPVSRYWINISSLGMSGVISGREHKYKFWGPLKYNVAALVEAIKYVIFKKSPVLLSYDGGEWEFVKNLTVLAACNGHTFASGMRISDYASPFSGDLDMVLIACGRNVLNVASSMKHFERGTPSRSKHVTSRRCKRLDVLAADSNGNPLEESMVYNAHADNGNEFSREDSNVSLEDSVEIQPEEGSDHAHPTRERSISGRMSPNTVKAIQATHKETLKTLTAHRYPVECDGECIGHLPASYEILPRALKFRIPKDTSLTGSK